MRTSVTPLREVVCKTLPEKPSETTVYRLIPNEPDEGYYRERTDRNLGWITPEEQKILRTSVIGIAGCGGMGGTLAATFARLGVGEVRIADCEEFDVSNINRQYAATRWSVGKSKAFETAKLARSVTDDTTLVIYPQGITEETVDSFLVGCNVCCDEIELLAIDARILLHQEARRHGVSLFNCNTVGFSTNLFLFTADSMPIEEMIGFDYEEAKRLRTAAAAGDDEAFDRIQSAIIKAVIPEIPEYCPEESEGTRAAFHRRIREEKRAAIIATNPGKAAGFLANRVLLYLLQHSGVKRNAVMTPPAPGYLHIDSAHMTSRVVEKGT